MAGLENMTGKWDRSTDSFHLIKRFFPDNVIAKLVLSQIENIDGGLDRNRILNIFGSLCLREKATENDKNITHTLNQIIIEELKRIKEDKEHPAIVNLKLMYPIDLTNTANIILMIYSRLNRTVLKSYFSPEEHVEIVECIREIFFDIVTLTDDISKEKLKRINFIIGTSPAKKVIEYFLGFLLEIEDIEAIHFPQENEYAAFLFLEVRQF